jgi:hypothetical protein
VDGTSDGERRWYEDRLDELKEKGLTTAERVEIKNWERAPLNETTWFTHCSVAKPEVIKAKQGLDPAYARELCIRAGGVLLGRSKGKFILCCVCQDPNKPVPARKLLDQGFLGGSPTGVYTEGYLYVFRVDPNVLPSDNRTPWACYCQNGVIKAGVEIAFDRRIPAHYMKVFKNYKPADKSSELHEDWTH